MLKQVLFACAVVCLWGIQTVECQPNDVIAPITDYRRGYKDRVEYIIAVINSDNLDSGTATNQATRDYSKSLTTYQIDDAGHLIAQRLGGTGRNTYNIVPQNRKTNRGSWRTQVESPIYDDVKAGNRVTFEVWPNYDGDQGTRPVSLRYSAKRDDGTVVVEGTFDNPPPDM